jgi:anti-sigma B factor antagonist
MLSALPAFNRPFGMSVRSDGQRAVVAVEGELDMAVVGRVQARFDDLVVASCPDIVADLRGLTFLDSEGLRLLVRLAVDARKSGWRFAIVDGSPVVRRKLEITGLTSYFHYAEAR